MPVPCFPITAVHLKTKTTKGNPQERYSWKWSIVTALYERGFSLENILQLYRLIDWFMILPEDLSKKFTENLIEYEEDRQMPFITSAERHGMEKGVEIGRNEGMLTEAQEMVLDALDTKFSTDIPSDIEGRIKNMTNRLMLKQLLRSAIQSNDMDGFRKSIDELTSE